VLKVPGTGGSTTGVRFYKTHNLKNLEALKNYNGWSPFSGEQLDAESISKSLADVYAQITSRDHKANAISLSIKPEETSGSTDTTADSDRLRAALFGLGNYAKVFIIPNLDRRICLAAVHELDPAQLGLESWGEGYMSTSPRPVDPGKFDVYFAAGYHHTHADIAVEALQNGACAVVEKPIATTKQQLKNISELLEKGSGRFFACFHKRYSQLNDWALADLAKEPGEAIDYHCMVFEIPLPPGHWYNWKTSGSRIVSNGCHWIDHFMFLNSYSPARKYSVAEAGRGQMTIQIELENGALFTMVLTDTGSPRLGVRDYIELRKGKNDDLHDRLVCLQF
jgi:predicted dehydrogenase